MLRRPQLFFTNNLSVTSVPNPPAFWECFPTGPSQMGVSFEMGWSAWPLCVSDIVWCGEGVAVLHFSTFSRKLERNKRAAVIITGRRYSPRTQCLPLKCGCDFAFCFCRTESSSFCEVIWLIDLVFSLGATCVWTLWFSPSLTSGGVAIPCNAMLK